MQEVSPQMKKMDTDKTKTRFLSVLIGVSLWQSYLSSSVHSVTPW